METRKVAMAEIALVGIAVPRFVIGLVLRRSVPLEEFLGDEALWVLGSNQAVDLVAIDSTSLWARASLEVVGHSSSRGEALFAKRAAQLRASMGARVEVLEAC